MCAASSGLSSTTISCLCDEFFPTIALIGFDRILLISNVVVSRRNGLQSPWGADSNHKRLAIPEDSKLSSRHALWNSNKGAPSFLPRCHSADSHCSCLCRSSILQLFLDILGETLSASSNTAVIIRPRLRSGAFALLEPGTHRHGFRRIRPLRRHRSSGRQFCCHRHHLLQYCCLPPLPRCGRSPVPSILPPLDHHPQPRTTSADVNDAHR